MKEGGQMRSTRALSCFAYSLSVIAVTGMTIFCSAQERQMGGVGITVFADQNFRGTIGRGVWQLCEGRDFTGRCITLDRSAPDLHSYNFGNRVRSLRPLYRQPR